MVSDSLTCTDVDCVEKVSADMHMTKDPSDDRGIGALAAAYRGAASPGTATTTREVTGVMVQGGVAILGRRA